MQMESLESLSTETLRLMVFDLTTALARSGNWFFPDNIPTINDGRTPDVLGLFEDGDMMVVYYDAVLDLWCDSESSGCLMQDITHWQPLPNPPG